MITYTNIYNVPAVMCDIAMYLYENGYTGGTYEPEDKVISATTLIKPVRMIVLEIQNRGKDRTVDVSDILASSRGTAEHKVLSDALEWANKTKGKNWRYEVRTEKKVKGWIVTGEFDYGQNGAIGDLKNTSTFTWMEMVAERRWWKKNAEFASIEEMQRHAPKTFEKAMQLSIYKWLNHDVTVNEGEICFNFTDWRRSDMLKNDKYPNSRSKGIVISPLISESKIQRFVEDKIELIDDILSGKKELPYCTGYESGSNELWEKPTLWKYYKDPKKTSRSTKNYTNEHEAMERARKEGGIVKKVRGEVRRCDYCNVRNVCEQYREIST